MRPDSGKSFGRACRGKLSTVDKRAIVIPLNLLHQIIWLNIYVEKKGSTHRSKMVYLCLRGFSNSYILMRMCSPRIVLHEVSQSEGELNVVPMNITYRCWGRVYRCRVVIVLVGGV